ncbi:MAG TPA: UDP-glucose 4-epimerase [Treponema sp.]|nr:MAG: UDP-glucose 4-epimerase [Treponema sp. GWC1_61_84]OHE70145.1 MAG: UDP-glucose 4-epimerase [Treponema sp. RIFOXYC1_FULL_61_9]HCM27876.1 UDP-glucose 4-epimerase [Treponema sp.]
MFNGKVLMITGGTGSFGNAVLRRFLDSGISEIRILSRDEKKQDEMRKRYENHKIKFYIGDVRDYGSIKDAFHCVDYVFHAAALKQVPSCEFFPMEAVKTNVVGSDNVMSACVVSGVKRAVFLSTDKAAYPINAMGMSKALMEKNVVARSRSVDPKTGPVFCITRYGNVMASRGSVIPLFSEQIDLGRPITITDPNMTRFLMTLDDAVDLVVYAFLNGNAGDLFIQKAPASTIADLADAVMEYKGKNTDKRVIGTRHGEKLFETLVTREEMSRATDHGDYYRIAPDGRDLNYDKYFSEGDSRIESVEEYTSHNTKRLDVKGVVELLRKLGGLGEQC